jgi:hypothetical protein
VTWLKIDDVWSVRSNVYDYRKYQKSTKDHNYTFFTDRLTEVYFNENIDIAPVEEYIDDECS